jgi:hypothetical protein
LTTTTPGAICTSHAGDSIGQSLDSEEGLLRIARASQTSDQTVSDQLIFAHALGSLTLSHAVLSKAYWFADRELHNLDWPATGFPGGKPQTTKSYFASNSLKAGEGHSAALALSAPEQSHRGHLCSPERIVPSSDAIVTSTLEPDSKRTSCPRSSVNVFSIRMSLYI